MALFLILQRIEPFTAGFSFEPVTASFRSRWLFFSYSRTSTILVIFVPKKLLFHLIPFIYGTSENRTFRPQNGFFFSIYALMEQYRFRRLFQTNTRRQTSPPATATVSDHFSTSNRISHISKKWLTAPHLELRRAGDTVRVTRSLSAASKQIFARKYALENSHRQLQYALLCTVL